MKWFKHYSNADTSFKLQELMDEMGVEGYAYYWLLLELLSEKYDGESIVFELHFNELSKKLKIRLKKKLDRVLDFIAERKLFTIERKEKLYRIEAPILSKLKDRDFKKTRNTRECSAPKKEEEDIDKELDLDNKGDDGDVEIDSKTFGAIQEFQNIPLAPMILKTVREKSQMVWLEAYHGDIEFFKSEFPKMGAWLDANPKKKPKTNTRFIANWLSRSWDEYRKKIPSNKATGRDLSDLKLEA